MLITSYHGEHRACPTCIGLEQRVSISGNRDPYVSPFTDFYFHELFSADSKLVHTYGYLRWIVYERRLSKQKEIAEHFLYIIGTSHG
jgi:heterodisulfide reductase subunit B